MIVAASCMCTGANWAWGDSLCIAYRPSCLLSVTGTISSYIVKMVAGSIYVPWEVWLIVIVHHGVDRL